MSIYLTIDTRGPVTWDEQATFLGAVIEMRIDGEYQHFRVKRVERYCVAQSWKLGWELERVPEKTTG